MYIIGVDCRYFFCYILQFLPVGIMPPCIPGDSNHPAGHEPHQALVAGEEPSVGSSITQRDSQALRGADGNIRTELCRRTEQGEGQQVGGAAY